MEIYRSITRNLQCSVVDMDGVIRSYRGVGLEPGTMFADVNRSARADNPCVIRGSLQVSGSQCRVRLQKARPRASYSEQSMTLHTFSPRRNKRKPGRGGVKKTPELKGEGTRTQQFLPHRAPPVLRFSCALRLVQPNVASPVLCTCPKAIVESPSL